MLSVSYAGKNAYRANKTRGVLRGGASGANRCDVLAHCGEGGFGEVTTPPLCDLTHVNHMQVGHTGPDLHRWEPLRITLHTLRVVTWIALGIDTGLFEGG